MLWCVGGIHTNTVFVLVIDSCLFLVTWGLPMGERKVEKYFGALFLRKSYANRQFFSFMMYLMGKILLFTYKGLAE